MRLLRLLPFKLKIFIYFCPCLFECTLNRNWITLLCGVIFFSHCWCYSLLRWARGCIAFSAFYFLLLFIWNNEFSPLRSVLYLFYLIFIWLARQAWTKPHSYERKYFTLTCTHERTKSIAFTLFVANYIFFSFLWFLQNKFTAFVATLFYLFTFQFMILLLMILCTWNFVDQKKIVLMYAMNEKCGYGFAYSNGFNKRKSL